jgi:hypothetical protein
VKDDKSVSLEQAPAGPRPAIADHPSSSVSAFVADAINEQRRNDGLSQLLADLASVAGQPTQAGRTPARNPSQVS